MQKVKSPLLLWTGFMAICIYLFLALLDTDQEHSVLITSPQTEPPSQSEQLHATGAFDPASIRDLAHQGMPVPRKDSIPIDTAQEPSLSYRQLVGIDQQVSIAVEHINYLQNSLSDQSRDDWEALGRQNEAREILDWALDRLGPEDRMVLELVYLEGLAVKEAARLLGWSTANVKVRAHRARKKINRWLLET